MARKETIILQKFADGEYEIVDVNDVKDEPEAYANSLLYRVERMIEVRPKASSITFEDVVKPGPKPKS